MRFVYTPHLIANSGERSNNDKIEFRRLLMKDDENREQIICENTVAIENVCVDELSFDSIDFNGGISLRNCKINKLNFLACNFKQDVDDPLISTLDLNMRVLKFTDCCFDGSLHIGSFKDSVESIELQSCRIYGDVLLGYLSILDIMEWTESKDVLELTSFGKVIMFFAKLFVTYGIWQTIYAFYKYKK